ncbi:hypothetical protein L5515_010477 [Caenorhabditis briggsae]|uniref:Serine/threonine specific protein phosphatases domain-containing protein n=1 Tax=Caenorhabditis briggsae TaxID=6238 RepID=A0AAE9EUQ9_CAEBR|nr:hypothetical protein L5515_010477 [Caenorhabditis briggsae]
MYGFYTERDPKYGPGIWWDFQCCFNRLSLAGLVSQKVFCVHGGLSRTHNGLEMDLLWADPTNWGDGWFQSYRGISYLFGKRVVDEACKRLNISLIIRSHMVVPDGFEVMTGRILITVFSVANYAGTANNAAAVLCVNEKLEVTYQKLTALHPLFQVSTLPLTANLDSTIALSDLKQVKRFVEF